MNIRAYILMIGLEEAAKKLEVSLPAVKHYRNGIRQVSPVNVISVCAATAGRSRHTSCAPMFTRTPPTASLLAKSQERLRDGFH